MEPLDPSPRREAAFFDLDKTVIARPSMVAYGRPLYDAGLITRRLVLRSLAMNVAFHVRGADEARMDKFREDGLRIIEGWDAALVSAIVRARLHDVITPIVYPGARALINEHRHAGRRVFLVSSAPEEIVFPVAQLLGVDESIASRAEIDADGRYTGRATSWSFGAHKADSMHAAARRHGIDLTRSFAYSDSATDLPMLEAVGRPVAVNPDRALTRVAAERDWPVERFSLRRSTNPRRTTVATSLAV